MKHLRESNPKNALKERKLLASSRDLTRVDSVYTVTNSSHSDMAISCNKMRMKSCRFPASLQKFYFYTVSAGWIALKIFIYCMFLYCQSNACKLLVECFANVNPQPRTYSVENEKKKKKKERRKKKKNTLYLVNQRRLYNDYPTCSKRHAVSRFQEKAYW